MNRLNSLDYLRGLAAFGIMLFHYLSWSAGPFTSDTLLGRVGIYGVSVFYVLSGSTLYHVYYDKMQPSRNDIMAFAQKRIFRIFPLLWVVTLLHIFLSGERPGATDLVLNLSGLFGFTDWDRNISTGAWSIGNELVFYVFFILFIFLTKRSKVMMLLLSMAILIIYLHFTFSILHPDRTISEQWRDYVNPLDQVLFFLGGYLIGLFLHNISIPRPIVVVVLLFTLGLFTFHPADGDLIHLVTGTDRLVFTACTFLICACMYKLDLELPSFLHRPLSSLGETSYSIYLLNPIMWACTGIMLGWFRDHSIPIHPSFKVILSIICTLVGSYFMYHYFEKRFMELGRRRANSYEIRH